MASQVPHWFVLADEDRDGAIAGAEAVRFFTKSGLPQDVLGQIWELASGGGPKLNTVQFTTALKLVSLAQASGGRLNPDQARVVAMGGGPQLPLPRLAGLTDSAPTPSIPTYAPQITGLQPQMTGGLQPQMTGGLQPQMTGGMPPAAAGMTGYVQQPTGAGATGGPQQPPAAYLPPQATGGGRPGSTGGHAPQATGGYGGVPAPAGGLPGFPPVTPADLQRYQATFVATDTDRDGLVKGAECFPVFMQSGLDKGLLKRMWDLVAGNAGQLSSQQFMQCMYLMDGMRRGAQLPPVLPPGPWPQVSPMPAAVTGQQQLTGGYGPGPAAAGLTGAAAAAAAGLTGISSSGGPLPPENWSLDSQFGHKGAVKAISDAYDQTLPRIPEPPGKFKYEPAAAAAAGGPSAVPDLDTAVASMLAPADKARWEAEQEEARKKEQQQRAAEAEATAAKARIEAFQAALTELVMFKSKTDVALLQASDAAARLKAEAEETELRYNRAHLAAQSQAEAGSKARQELQALLARKQEAANKLELLQEELKMMANLNPAELVALEKEVGGLVAAAAAAESRKAALEMQLDSGRAQKELLAGRISDLQLAAAAGEGEIKRAREELAELQSKVSAAEGAALAPDALGEVGPLLGTAASAYRRLYSTALAAGLEVPYAANLNNVGALVWLEQLLSGTADWVDDDEQAASGYTVVNALPDLEGVPAPLLRAAALAAAAQPPVRLAALQPRAQLTPAAAAGGQQQDAAGGTAAAAAAGAAAAAQPEAAAAAAGPAATDASGGSKGVVAAVAATVAAAAAGGTAVAAATDKGSGGGGADSSSIDAPAAAAAAAADPAAVAPGAGSAVERGALGSSAAAVAGETEAPLAERPLTDMPASAAAAAAGEAPLEPAPAVVPAPAESAAVAEGAGVLPPPLVVPAVVVPPGHRKSLADEDDSDVLSSGLLSPAALSGVQPQAAALGGLSGFDPAAYRLADASTGRGLAQQHSFDSSYAGSFTAGPSSAGLTGASGFDDEAFGPGAGSTGASAAAGGLSSAAGEGGAGVGFEDNAF